MYGVWCSPWFQAPTEGLEMYPLQVRGCLLDYGYNGIQCITLAKSNYVQSQVVKSMKQNKAL